MPKVWEQEGFCCTSAYLRGDVQEELILIEALTREDGHFSEARVIENARHFSDIPPTPTEHVCS